MEVVPIFDQGVWQDATADASFSQSWAYGAVAEGFGARVHRFVLVQDGSRIGAIQALSRGIGRCRVLYAPGGIHCVGAVDPPDTSRAVLRACPGHRVVVAPGPLGLPVGSVPDTAICDLTRRRPKAWRNAVARAERQGLFVMEHAGCPDWLWARHRDHGRARRYRGLPRSWLSLVEQRFSGTVRTFAAYADGTPVAGIVVLRQGRRWTYQIGWAGAEGRRTGGHNLLLECAMIQAAEHGGVRFDLGVAPVSAPGLRRFKLSCGADIVPGQRIRATLAPVRLNRPFPEDARRAV